MSLHRKVDGSLTRLGRVGRSLGLGRLLYHLYYRPLRQLRRLRVPDRPVEVPLFGQRFHMPSPRRYDCFRGIYLDGVWEPAVTQAVRDIVRPGMNVALIGADVGYYVLLTAALNRPGRVFAFEPFPAHFAILERNVRDNGLDHVRLFQIAAGDREQTAELVNPGTESRLDLSEAGDKTGERVSVPVRPLDAVLASVLQGGTKLDFVQIDVEGAEAAVFRGMEQLLARDRPTLLVEIHGPLLPRFGTTKEDFLRWVADRGYEAQWIDGEALAEPGYSHALFVPRGLPAARVGIGS
jgi:FkbM family methyltransferase